MKKNNRKSNRIIYLISLSFLLLFISSIYSPTINKVVEINDDETIEEDLVETPEVSAIDIHNFTGEGSTTGLYGFTNGTREDDFDADDDKFSESGGYYESTHYTIATPAYVAEQPWQIDANTVEVENLRDVTDHIPDSDFTTDADWNETDTLGAYGSVEVDEGNNRGMLEFERNTQTQNENDFDTWSDLDPTITPNRNQNDGDGETGGDFADGYARGGTNTITFTGYLGSEVGDTDDDDCYTGDNDDCSCSCSSSASIGDSLSVDFTEIVNYFNIVEINNPVATMSYDINFDDTYCQTSSRHGTGSPNYVESTTEQYDSTARVRIFIKHNLDSVWTEAHDTGVLSFDEGTSDYSDEDVSVNADVSSALTAAGQYQIKHEVYFTFSNNYAGSASDSDSCGGHCSVDCDSHVESTIANYLRLSVSDIDIAVDDLESLPDGDLTFSAASVMDFANREVDEEFNQELSFIVESDDELSGTYGETRVYARLNVFKGPSLWTIDRTWGRINVYINNPVALTWDIDEHVDWDHLELDGADSVQLFLGVKTSDFVLDWGAGADSNVYFQSVNLTLEGRPDVEDIDLEIVPYNTDGGTVEDINNGASKGDGSASLFYDYTGVVEHSFRSTSESLTFDFYHTLELSYEVWGHTFTELITHYYTEGDNLVEFYLNFSVTTPYGSYDDFEIGNAYQDNFYLILIYPKFDYLGSSYWDLRKAYVDGKSKKITGQDNILQVDENSNIYTPGLSPTPYYGDRPVSTQYGIMYNDLMDEWISGSSQVLDWNILFTHPNVMDDLILADNGAFSPETDVFISEQDTVHMRGTLGANPEKGNASIRIWSPRHHHIESNYIANGSINTNFDSSIDLSDNIGLPGKDNYIADCRFTQLNIANRSSNDVCTGVYKVGFQKKSIDIVRDTTLNGPIMSHEIYNTITDKGLIEIKVNYYDTGYGTPITDADATITVGDYETIGAAYLKNPILYNLHGWLADYPMKNLNNGSYVIYMDPTRNSDGTLAGNMTWGFHNFTINVERNGYLSKVVEGNVSIEIDTYLRHYGVLYADEVTHQNKDLGWPHYVEGRPAGDPLVFQAQYVMNDSAAGSSISNRTGHYRNNVYMTYELNNGTAGLVNWSAVSDIIGEGFNPINGSYYETANDGIFEMTIKWPTFDLPGLNMPRYIPGIVLEYNVTAYIMINNTMNRHPSGYFFPQFQPELVETSSCENESSAGVDVWGNDYKVVEETIRFELVEYESVNKTQVTLYNNITDNNEAFAMGTYDNATHTYVIRNYYQNNTHDWFNVRARFECTNILRDLASDEAPPIGPLNKTNVFYGKVEPWAGNTSIIASSTNAKDFELVPDESITWTKEVNTTGSGTPINSTGVTYVSPRLYYQDFTANTYVYTIKAEKDGFQESIITLIIDVLPQETALYNNSGDEIDKTLNPISLSTPRWNTTSFIIQYNDTTNPGEHETIDTIDSIEIVDDDTIDERFVNSSGNDDYWKWRTLGDGKYEITILYTDMDPTDVIMIFNVNKENYSTGEFALDLNIRRRNATFHLVWTKRDGRTVYCDPIYFGDPLNDNVTNLILSYEIRDQDNLTGGTAEIVDLRDLPGITVEQILSSFSVDVFTEGIKFYTDPTTGHVRYNITIAADKALGWHTIDARFSNNRVDDFYSMPLHNDDGSIKIEKISTNITITSILPIEKSFLHWGQTRELALLPKFSFEYWDENHSMQIDPAGLLLDGNWTNTHNDGVDSLDQGALNEDITLQTSGLTGSIYFDIQMIDARNGFYYTNITLNKTNYETIYAIMKFRIQNQSTSFLNDELYYGSLLFGETTNLDDGDLYLDYASGEYLLINWGSYLGFRFTYISAYSVYITNDTTNGMPISYRFTAVDSDLITPLIDKTNGVYRFDLDFENVTQEGSVDVLFNFTVFAKNFDPVTYTINLTVIDRVSTIQVLKSPDDDLTWTQIANYQIQFIDQEYYTKYGLYGNFYITSAEINGTTHGNGGNVTLDGLETNWWIEELPEGRYNIYINTTNLVVKDSAYALSYIFNKTHYETSIAQISLDFNPVEFTISATLDPSSSFIPEIQEEVEIVVSLFVTTYYWDAGRNVEEELEVNVDFDISGITVLFEIFDEDGDSLLDGECEWDSGEKAFVAKIKTDFDGDETAGVFDLEITVESENANYKEGDTEISIVALGTVEGEIPLWFYPLLFTVIGASIAIAGYAIRKAIYLRIPFVLRKIDETIKKIEKDKYPAVGVMTGRDIFIINKVVSLLEDVGIDWERKDKFEVKKAGEVEAKEKLEPLTLEEIQQALTQIPELSKEEIVLFTDELKRLNRDAQNEFLASLRGDNK